MSDLNDFIKKAFKKYKNLKNALIPLPKSSDVIPQNVQITFLKCVLIIAYKKKELNEIIHNFILKRHKEMTDENDEDDEEEEAPKIRSSYLPYIYISHFFSNYKEIRDLFNGTIKTLEKRKASNNNISTSPVIESPSRKSPQVETEEETEEPPNKKVKLNEMTDKELFSPEGLREFLKSFIKVKKILNIHQNKLELYGILGGDGPSRSSNKIKKGGATMRKKKKRVSLTKQDFSEVYELSFEVEQIPKRFQCSLKTFLAKKFTTGGTTKTIDQSKVFGKGGESLRTLEGFRKPESRNIAHLLGKGSRYTLVELVLPKGNESNERKLYFGKKWIMWKENSLQVHLTTMYTLIHCIKEMRKKFDKKEDEDQMLEDCLKMLKEQILKHGGKKKWFDTDQRKCIEKYNLKEIKGLKVVNLVD